MNINAATIAVCSLVVASLLTAARTTHAEEVKPLYASMAPFEQYLMPDRLAEITLARSAAPAAISDRATVLVLTRQGYEVAIRGRPI